MRVTQVMKATLVPRHLGGPHLRAMTIMDEVKLASLPPASARRA
jgi:hypothetical protein